MDTKQLFPLVFAATSLFLKFTVFSCIFSQSARMAKFKYKLLRQMPFLFFTIK